MRGQEVLYNVYLEPVIERTKGRSANAMNERNQALSARYYYYMHYQRKRFDDIIFNLCREFYLSEKRMIDVLQEIRYLIDDYMKVKPELKALKKEFTWFVWE